MDQEIWQQLLSLEVRDITQRWYSIIHGRALNVRRTKEINAAAKQAREFFRNASHSDQSVRPLLTFYGVASLSRALLLLLKRDGGEEGLTSGHGLNTVNWGDQLSGDRWTGFQSLIDLKVETCAGLFNDFIKGTDNRISMHVNSAGVDWRLNYAVPDLGNQISLGDLLARIPDLHRDYSQISSDIRYASANEVRFEPQKGFTVKVRDADFDRFKAVYLDMGYKVETQEQWSILTADTEVFETNSPLFVHTYVQKMFGSIPILYIAEPFPGRCAYSQLCITYLAAYYLGMLVRYYPTHWMSLLQGEKGDSLWPTLNRAQQFVEISYPELVIEMINDMLRERQKNPSS